jgi:NTP pyrophosphatase (non-canonical NTP hydrolase)
MGNHCLYLPCERCGEEYCVRCEVCDCKTKPKINTNMGYKNKIDFLKQLRLANKDRVNKFPPAHHELNDWSLTDWACAVAGETGELCNLVKKLHRGDNIDMQAIAHEAADIVIYLDLFCQRAGLVLADCIEEKFNQTSEKIGTPEIKLWNYN